MTTSALRPLCLLAASLVVGLTFGFPQEAYALKQAVQDPKVEAEERFNKGVAFSKSGEHRAALLEFKKAYELSPSWVVLYNLGQTSRELKDHANALTWFERYLAEGASNVPVKRRRLVELAIKELRPKVAEIRLTVVAGAEISMDDVPVGIAPLGGPLRANAGRVKVSATLKDHMPAQRLVDVAGAEKLDVTLELTPLAPVVRLPDPTPSQTKPLEVTQAPLRTKADNGLGAWPWVMVGTTGALGIATIILGVRALGSESDYQDELLVRTSADELEALRDKATSFALATDIMASVTAAGAVTSLILIVVDATASEAEAPAAKVHAGPGFVGVSGAF